MGDYDFFAKFAADPTDQNYRAIFAVVIAQPSWDPYATDLAEVMQLLKDGQFEAARTRCLEMMPNRVLNPRAHWLLSKAAEGMHDADAAQFEMMLASRCVQGILATGDGSMERPWLVTAVEDEYDLLGLIGRRPHSQASMTTSDGRELDVMHCPEGDAHFDITAIRRALDRQFSS
ncbi:MAG TPA: DUF4919 domain-containing protein [Candidatus Xenobia bacterium]|jgi:hypothetical protein